MTDSQDILRQAKQLLKEPIPVLDEEDLFVYLRSFFEKAETFLNAAHQHGSPLYLFDEQTLLERAQQFRDAFNKFFPDFHIFYAVKSNNHPLVAKSLVNFGLGLDVSSGLELKLALSCGCRNIIFSGPGKTESELRLAAENSVVTVLIDSFTELERLERVARSLNNQVRAGVRLTTDEQGIWRKFGVALSNLESFMNQAETCSHVNLSGLQFHTSWNRNPQAQIAFLKRLGQTLQKLSQRHLAAIKFLDIGGGYWPSRGEWLQFAGIPAGRLYQVIHPEVRPSTKHYKLEAQPINAFAQQLSTAMTTHISPFVNCQIYAEPGRWLSNDAMHIVLTVIDKKADDLVITDAGTNIIGWERFETDFAPVINLSRPSQSEHECLVLGSLCTPHDVWGYSYFGDDIQTGDVLLIPSQGAYTYSLRQEFIKPLANVMPL